MIIFYGLLIKKRAGNTMDNKSKIIIWISYIFLNSIFPNLSIEIVYHINANKFKCNATLQYFQH